MRFKPTGIVDWILVGYAGFLVVLALIVAPLVIGLGDDHARSSPLSVVRFPRGGGLLVSMVGGRVGRSRLDYRSRVRGYRGRVRRQVVSADDPCLEAIERMIACTADPAARKALLSRKHDMAVGCRRLEREVRNARRCVKIQGCKAFERCLGGS